MAPDTFHHRRHGLDRPAYDRPASIRRWAWVCIAAQVLFVLSWLVAAAWQGPRYSILAHSISDMYAVTAPGGMVLVIVLTICGAATMWFTLRSAWPVLRPGGWTATVGCALLALSVLGLGDLLSPFERLACRAADPGCTAARAMSNSGGKLDDTLTSAGVLLLVLAGFFLAAAMRRVPGWQRWAWPARGTAVLIFALIMADAQFGGTAPLVGSGLSGLVERLLAAAAAGAVAALAIGILRPDNGSFSRSERANQSAAAVFPALFEPGSPSADPAATVRPAPSSATVSPDHSAASSLPREDTEPADLCSRNTERKPRL